MKKEQNEVFISENLKNKKIDNQLVKISEHFLELNLDNSKKKKPRADGEKNKVLQLTDCSNKEKKNFKLFSEFQPLLTSESANTVQSKRTFLGQYNKFNRNINSARPQLTSSSSKFLDQRSTFFNSNNDNPKSVRNEVVGKHVPPIHELIFNQNDPGDQNNYRNSNTDENLDKISFGMPSIISNTYFESPNKNLLAGRKSLNDLRSKQIKIYDKNKVNKIFHNGIPKKKLEIIKNSLKISNLSLKKNRKLSPPKIQKNTFNDIIYESAEYIYNEYNKTSKWHQNTLKKHIDLQAKGGARVVRRNLFSEQHRIPKKVADVLFREAKSIYSSLPEEVEIENLKYLYKEKNQQIVNNKKRWKYVIILAAEHFKRLKLSAKEFFENKHICTTPYEHENFKELVGAIKENDKYSIIRLLYQNKLLVHGYDHFGQTPLHWAAKRDRYKLVPVLIFYGARVDAKDNAGRSPLYCAAEYSCFDSVKVLLIEMANPLLMDNQGKLPLDVTTNKAITFYLQRAKNLHIVHRIGNAKFMYDRIKKGLKFIIEFEENPLIKNILRGKKEN